MLNIKLGDKMILNVITAPNGWNYVNCDCCGEQGRHDIIDSVPNALNKFVKAGWVREENGLQFCPDCVNAGDNKKMKIHDYKIEEEFFNDILENHKSFEFRIDDREERPTFNDIVNLQTVSGKKISVRVNYVIDWERLPTIPKQYFIFGFWIDERFSELRGD